VAIFIKNNCDCCQPTVCDGCTYEPCEIGLLFGGATSVAYSYNISSPNYSPVIGSGVLHFPNLNAYSATDGVVSISSEYNYVSGGCDLTLDVFSTTTCWTVARGISNFPDFIPIPPGTSFTIFPQETIDPSCDVVGGYGTLTFG